MKQRLVAALLAAGLAATVLPACSVNPATGQQMFSLMSPEEEQRVGAQEHPKILAEFGGAYDNAKVAAYVQQLGTRLAAASEIPNQKFTFTVIDSPIVNAFALPGGFVYVSRGLMALARSEAELSGVIGHEIGHVVARHSAQRYTAAVGAGVGSQILGIFLGGVAAQAAAPLLQGALASYSRDQELEADTLGVRYLARTGYQTRAMADFLAEMEAYAQFEARQSGEPDPAERYNIMSTHPRTPERVQQAIVAANVAPVAGARVAADEYLRAIDGLTFGESEKEGLVRGRAFFHKPLDFHFAVPDGFKLTNTPKQVVARGPNNAAILFTGGPRGYRGSMTDYIRNEWMARAQLSGLERIDVNGMEAATAATRVSVGGRTMDARFVAIRHGQDSIYRFVMLTQLGDTARLSAPLRETTYSFRRLTAEERAGIRSRRIAVRSVQPGMDVAHFARQMQVDSAAEEWFRVINGLIVPGEQPAPGTLVKIIVQ
ncbi:MAG: peptidase M48 [Alphaproteobacteria bacterium]|nr:peptidase M48 [Alphaproteobacteria bacterium]